MVFRIDYSDLFIEDLNRAINYISKELCNPQAAKELYERIDQSLSLLENFPYSCPIVPNAFIPRKDLRRKVINNYSLFYQIDEQNKIVLVLRLILSRRTK